MNCQVWDKSTYFRIGLAVNSAILKIHEIPSIVNVLEIFFILEYRKPTNIAINLTPYCQIYRKLEILTDDMRIGDAEKDADIHGHEWVQNKGLSRKSF